MTEILNHWAFGLLDLIVTAYLVYYYVVNENRKSKDDA